MRLVGARVTPQPGGIGSQSVLLIGLTLSSQGLGCRQRLIHLNFSPAPDPPLGFLHDGVEEEQRQMSFVCI